MTASTTLTDLEPGIYRLTASAFRTADPIVSEAYELVAALSATVAITGNPTEVGGLAFSPPPDNLPINAP